MAFMYQYTRERITSGEYTGRRDINNPSREDGSGNRLYLADEVQTALPGKVFYVHLSGSTCNVEFEIELDSAEQSTLDTVVANHKANT